MSRIGEDPTRFGLQPRPEAASSQTSGPKTTLRAPDGSETQQPRSPGKLHLKFLRHRTRADCSYPTTPKSSQIMCSLFFALRGQLFSPLISPGGGIGDLKENRSHSVFELSAAVGGRIEPGFRRFSPDSHAKLYPRRVIANSSHAGRSICPQSYLSTRLEDLGTESDFRHIPQRASMHLKNMPSIAPGAQRVSERVRYQNSGGISPSGPF